MNRPGQLAIERYDLALALGQLLEGSSGLGRSPGDQGDDAGR
jgi:hypothetical protein